MQIKQAVCFLFFDDIMLVSSNTLMPEQVFGNSEHLPQSHSSPLGNIYQVPTAKRRIRPDDGYDGYDR